MHALEEHCDVVFLAYMVDMNGQGATHQVINSPRLDPVAARNLKNGILEDIVGQKHFVVPRKKLHPAQEYSAILHKLVSDSKCYTL